MDATYLAALEVVDKAREAPKNPQVVVRNGESGIRDGVDRCWGCKGSGDDEGGEGSGKMHDWEPV